MERHHLWLPHQGQSATPTTKRSEAGRTPRPRPSRRRLTAEQEHAVQLYIRTRPPIANITGQTLWTKASAHDLVHELAGVDLPERTFSAYLKRWDMIPQKPLQRAHTLRPAVIRQWMAASYPVIAAQAREAQAELLWFDVHRMAILDGRITDGHIDDHMIFLTDSRGHLEWTICTTQPTTEEVISFMDRAKSKAERRMHVLFREPFLAASPAFTQWHKSNENRIAVIGLPTTDGAVHLRTPQPISA